MKRLLIATCVALAVSAGAAAHASAADINVVAPRSGDTKTVSFDSLESQFDVDSDYVIRGASGNTVTKHVKGISIAKLLATTGAEAVYSGLEIARPGGASIVLSKVQVIAAGATPAIYAEGGNLVFIRPSYGASDVNANDIVTVAGALTLKQTDLGALAIGLKASKTKAKVGDRVEFSATATGGGAGRAYTYKWNFNDGTTDTGAVATHKFTKRGTYRVLVAVKAEGADRSDAKVVEIQVGAAVKSKKNRSGGGTNDAAGAPVSGAADGDSGSGDQAATQQQSAQPRKKKKAKRAAPNQSLQVVRGQVLLSSETEPLTPSSTLAARSGSKQPAEPKSSGLGISTGVWAALATALILAFGAALENGKIRLRPTAG
jgi:PKD repeat protein